MAPFIVTAVTAIAAVAAVALAMTMTMNMNMNMTRTMTSVIIVINPLSHDFMNDFKIRPFPPPNPKVVLSRRNLDLKRHSLPPLPRGNKVPSTEGHDARLERNELGRFAANERKARRAGQIETGGEGRPHGVDDVVLDVLLAPEGHGVRVALPLDNGGVERGGGYRHEGEAGGVARYGQGGGERG